MRGGQGFFAAALALCILLVGVVVGSVLPARADVPANVVAGYQVWRDHGCESCHSLYGQGGFYAPDLTGIYAQRGADYLRAFMANPAAFHPGERVMPRFGLTVSALAADGSVIREGQTEQVLAFLAWVGQPENAGSFPPRALAVSGGGSFDLGQAVEEGTNTTATPAERGRALYSRSCASCHSLERDVIIIGPSLWGIADRAWHRVIGLSADQYLRESIVNPGAFVVEGFTDVMQKNFGEVLSSDEIGDLLAFLLTLQEEA